MLALSLFFLLLIRVVNGDDEDDLVFELTSDRPRFGFHGARLSQVKTITIRVGNEVSYEIGYTQNGCNNLDTENGNVKCDDKPPFTIVDVALESPKTGSRVYGVVPSGRGTVFTWIWQVNARSELIFQAPPFGDSSSLEYSVTVQINDDNGEIIPSFPGLRNNEVNSPLTFSVLFQYGTIIANPETYDEIENGPLVMVKALHSGNVDDFCPGQSIECHPDTIFSFYAGPMPIPIGPETLNDEFLLTKVRGGVPVYSRNTVTTVTTTNGCSFCLVFDARAASEFMHY
ncbi:unnamed protein product, partial [Mesorhabditis belari]|uniref:Uncharacterized protein n=1 Tax=Mesorhabditis belari TaxID=2138241 RepID=A0AAF3FFW8_9BILA